MHTSSLQLEIRSATTAGSPNVMLPVFAAGIQLSFSAVAPDTQLVAYRFATEHRLLSRAAAFNQPAIANSGAVVGRPCRSSAVCRASRTFPNPTTEGAVVSRRDGFLSLPVGEGEGREPPSADVQLPIPFRE